MKKLILTAACTAMAAASGFAQGYVQFQNSISTQYYFNSTASAANKVSAATIASQAAAGATSTGVIDIGLYWSTAAFTDASQATLGGIVTMSATAGTIAGAASYSLGPTTSPSEAAYIQIFAWDSSYATPDAAIAAGAYFGSSSAGQANTVYGALGTSQLVSLGGAAPAPAAQLYGTGLPYFPRTVLLQNVPEPTTLALGGLGAAALLMFRRRK